MLQKAGQNQSVSADFHSRMSTLNFCFRTGQLLIAVAHTDDSPSEKPGQLSVAVADRGCGHVGCHRKVLHVVGALQQPPSEGKRPAQCSHACVGGRCTTRESKKRVETCKEDQVFQPPKTSLMLPCQCAQLVQASNLLRCLRVPF